MAISAAAISLYLALAERVAALWLKLRGKKVVDTASGVTVERFYRKRPSAKVLIPLVFIFFSGCAAFKAGNIDELKTLCETIVPCQPCEEAKEETKPSETTTTTETTTKTKDEIDPATITWDESVGNVGEWKISAEITSAKITSEKITIEHAQLTWDKYQKAGWDKPARGNIWIVAKCNDGKYHAATMEWLLDQTVIDNPGFDGGDDIHGCVGSEYRPKSGDVVGLMLSTFARSGVVTTKERSNIKSVTLE